MACDLDHSCPAHRPRSDESIRFLEYSMDRNAVGTVACYYVDRLRLCPDHTGSTTKLEWCLFAKVSTSGWTNEYICWNLGMLTATWGFVGE